MDFFQQKYWDKEINRSLQVKYSENFHFFVQVQCSLALVYWSQISPACFSQFSFCHFAFKTSILKFWILGNIPMVKSERVYKNWTIGFLKILWRFCWEIFRIPSAYSKLVLVCYVLSLSNSLNIAISIKNEWCDFAFEETTWSRGKIFILMTHQDEQGNMWAYM